MDGLFGGDSGNMSWFVDQNAAKLVDEFIATFEQRSDPWQILGLRKCGFDLDLLPQLDRADDGQGKSVVVRCVYGRGRYT